MSQETEILFDTAVLGKQWDDFMRSDIGRYLDDCLAKEHRTGLDELVNANPADAEAVRAAQNKVWRAVQLRSWIQSSIVAGLKATAVLESRDDEDDFL